MTPPPFCVKLKTIVLLIMTIEHKLKVTLSFCEFGRKKCMLR